MYKKFCKANFYLEHYWNLLRHLPILNNDFATKKPKSQKETPLISSPSDCVLLESSDVERPIGRKTAKEMEKKRKRPRRRSCNSKTDVLKKWKRKESFSFVFNNHIMHYYTPSVPPGCLRSLFARILRPL